MISGFKVYGLGVSGFRFRGGSGQTCRMFVFICTLTEENKAIRSSFVPNHTAVMCPGPDGLTSSRVSSTIVWCFLNIELKVYHISP